MTDSQTILSPEGARRREQILRLARRAATGRRRRRLALRGGLALAGVAVLAVALWPDPAVRTVGPSPDQWVQHPNPAPPTPRVVDIQTITTDLSLVDRLALRPQQRGWQSIDDDEFLKVLADAGKPSGLIELNGRSFLIRHVVSNH